MGAFDTFLPEENINRGGIVSISYELNRVANIKYIDIHEQTRKRKEQQKADKIAKQNALNQNSKKEKTKKTKKISQSKQSNKPVLDNNVTPAMPRNVSIRFVTKYTGHDTHYIRQLLHMLGIVGEECSSATYEIVNGISTLKIRETYVSVDLTDMDNLHKVMDNMLQWQFDPEYNATHATLERLRLTMIAAQSVNQN